MVEGSSSSSLILRTAVRRNWHLALARWLPGFLGPFPPPLWMSAGSIHLLVAMIDVRRGRVKSEMNEAPNRKGASP